MASVQSLDPCEPLTETAERDYLSFSAVSTFQSCPLRYYFRYIRNLPDECVAASLVFGSSIHAAVQMHFEQLLAGFAAPDLATLLAAGRCRRRISPHGLQDIAVRVEHGSRRRRRAAAIALQRACAAAHRRQAVTAAIRRDDEGADSGLHAARCPEQPRTGAPHQADHPARLASDPGTHLLPQSVAHQLSRLPLPRRLPGVAGLTVSPEQRGAIP